MIRPDFDTFAALAERGDLVAVSREIPFDTETAVTAYAKLFEPPFGFLLESVTGGERWARWTFLGTSPREAWRADPGGRVRRWTPDAGWDDGVVVDDPLEDLAARLRAQRPVTPPGVPRFFGGAVGYLGYDVVRHIEALPEPPPDPFGLPEAVLMFTDLVLAIDNVYGRAQVIAMVAVGGGGGGRGGGKRQEAGGKRQEAGGRRQEAGGRRQEAGGGGRRQEAGGGGSDEGEGSSLRAAYDAAVGRIDALVERLFSAPGPAPLVGGRGQTAAGTPGAAGGLADFASSFGRPAFQDAVRRVKEYIAAGDAFQVVLSQRLDVELDGRTPFEVYRRLRSLNPSPYMYFLELDGVSIAGASPEVLVRVEDRAVTVRPIAGTRPRGASETDDRALEAELLADPKERAEHLMLVDLGRNDVGRVARYGSVQVPELMVIERYSHVLHMVSQVTGELRDGLDAFDAFRATFPAGTVSGAPKVRAMEIIDELEPERRGPYAGAVGYFSYGATSMDTAIAIRTLVAADGKAHVQAGAGIVADSVPEKEYEETLAKARALLKVLGR